MIIYIHKKNLPNPKKQALGIYGYKCNTSIVNWESAFRDIDPPKSIEELKLEYGENFLFFNI